MRFPTASPASERSRTATFFRSSLPWLALAGAFLFSMFWGFRSFGIQDNNEGIYAEIAREMRARGDWIVPHLDGVPYLEKPPLLYWIEATLFSVFGEHDWVVRLGPVLCFAGTIAALLWVGRQIRSWSLGRNAALLLCSAAGIVGMGRSLIFDVPLMCALTWSLALFLKWRLSGSRWALRAVYATLAIGVMAKGLIALVLGGGAISLATVLSRRSLRDVLALVDGVGCTIFAAIVIPWHVLASIREPGFAEFYFINEHVRRFLGSREPHDFYTGPAYYYLVRLPLYLGVWVFALPLLIAKRRDDESPEAAAGDRAGREGRTMLLCAVAVSVAFFSLSEGKANYYLLSTMPALALLIANAWPTNGTKRNRLLVCAVGVAFFGVVFGIAPLAFAGKPKVAVLLDGQQPLLAVVSVILLGLAAAIALLTRRRRHNAAFWAVAAAGLAILLPVPAVLARADGTLSERAVAAYLREHGDALVVLYRNYEELSSFVYYHGRPVPVVDSVSNELLYAHKRYASDPSFLDARSLRELARHRSVWVVATPGQTDQVLREFGGESARVVRRFPRAVVMAIGTGTPNTLTADVRSYGAAPAMPNRPMLP